MKGMQPVFFFFFQVASIQMPFKKKNSWICRHPPKVLTRMLITFMSINSNDKIGQSWININISLWSEFPWLLYWCININIFSQIYFNSLLTSKQNIKWDLFGFSFTDIERFTTTQLLQFALIFNTTFFLLFSLYYLMLLTCWPKFWKKTS